MISWGFRWRSPPPPPPPPSPLSHNPQLLKNIHVPDETPFEKIPKPSSSPQIKGDKKLHQAITARFQQYQQMLVMLRVQGAGAQNPTVLSPRLKKLRQVRPRHPPTIFPLPLLLPLSPPHFLLFSPSNHWPQRRLSSRLRVRWSSGRQRASSWRLTPSSIGRKEGESSSSPTTSSSGFATPTTTSTCLRYDTSSLQPNSAQFSRSNQPRLTQFDWGQSQIHLIGR